VVCAIGIEREDLRHLFTLFAQGDTSRSRRPGGLGIGLAVVESFVTLHEGKVGVESAGRGQGAAFTVELPLLSSPAPSETAISPEAVAGPPGGARVLLVDDLADSREIFEELLSSTGHDVVVAADAANALELLGSQTFDAAIIDIGLPDLDGHTLARLTRERLGARTPRLVALTGYATAEHREASARAGFDVHLVKPVDAAVLLAALARAV